MDPPEAFKTAVASAGEVESGMCASTCTRACRPFRASVVASPLTLARRGFEERDDTSPELRFLTIRPSPLTLFSDAAVVAVAVAVGVVVAVVSATAARNTEIELYPATESARRLTLGLGDRALVVLKVVEAITVFAAVLVVVAVAVLVMVVVVVALSGEPLPSGASAI